MQKNAILLENLTIEQLCQLIGTSVKNGIDELQKELATKDNLEELLTREQTCKLLQIDSSTLWHWTNKRKIIAYGIGNRRYYKKSELMESLVPMKR